MRGSMSFVDSRVNFGLGKEVIIDTLTIIWPDKKRTIKTKIKANQFLSLSQENGILSKRNNFKEKPKQNFKDVTSELKLNYKHNENNFVDFDRGLGFEI